MRRIDQQALLQMPVDNALQRTHVTFDHVLGLVRQLRLHFLLQTTQQEWPKDFVKTANDQHGLFLIQLHLFARLRKWSVEPKMQ